MLKKEKFSLMLGFFLDEIMNIELKKFIDVLKVLDKNVVSEVVIFFLER